jgi:hypothetical protein
MLTGSYAAASIISLILMMVMASILEAGLLQYISNLWNGRPAGILTLFVHARRVLRLMDAVRESGRTGKSIDFE